MEVTAQIAVVRRVALILGASRYRGEIDDLVQDGLVRLLEAPAFRPGPGSDEACYSAWQAHCGMVDGLRRTTGWDRRRKTRRREYTDVDALIAAGQEPAIPPTQEAACDGAILAARMHRAVASLPPRLAGIVRRYYYDDVPMWQIGEEFGVNESRISQLLREARARLREALGAEA